MHRLKVIWNQFSYDAAFEHPMLDWLRRPEIPAKALIEAFTPFGYGPNCMNFRPSLNNISDENVLYSFAPYGTYSITHEQIVASFTNVTGETLKKIPLMVAAADKSLRQVLPSLKLRHHQFTYGTHASIATGAKPAEVLKPFVSYRPQIGGDFIGAGVLLHWKVPNHEWVTQLTLDHSLAYPDAIFIHFILRTNKDLIDIAHFVAKDVAEYFGTVLSSHGLTFTEG